MYKVLLADDEGIVLDSLRFIIEKNFGESCEIRTAKSGRMVIETAQEFSPDIIFLDIQMPGLNGIDAMREIRTFNKGIVFIIVSAYDRFDFAQEALSLGARKYILKPFNKEKVISALEDAIQVVKETRKKRSTDLQIREKLQAVVPLIESGFINMILFQEVHSEEMEHYMQLLDIKAEYGVMMAIQFGEYKRGDEMDNVIGSSVKLFGSAMRIRELVKEFFHKAVVSSVMANKVIVFLPWERKQMEFEDRSRIIEQARNLVYKLQKQMKLKFRIGIGNVKDTGKLHESCEEAQKALRGGRGSVVHSHDMNFGRSYEEDYPVELEEELFGFVKSGKIEESKEVAGEFFDWMVRNYSEHPKDIQTKVLEFVMTAEREAFLQGGMRYGLLYRKNYLETVISCASYEELRRWFLQKTGEACRNVAEQRMKQSNSVVEKAKAYIALHFDKELSLEDVARHVDISSYYFSKLFKEEEGKNFVEYVTELRIGKAKELLRSQEVSIKEVCVNVGYSDPNYFSRIFKKVTGYTPTEYKDGMSL